MKMGNIEVVSDQSIWICLNTVAGEPETNKDHYLFITRFKNWGTWPFNYKCAGHRLRMVCVFAVGDLKLLASRPELFANKFHLDWEPLALDCMEELHYNRTGAQVLGENDHHVDLSFYTQLDFVKNHVIVDKKSWGMA